MVYGLHDMQKYNYLTLKTYCNTIIGVFLRYYYVFIRTCLRV